MGRKPIKSNLRMKQFTHWLDPEVMEAVRAEVGVQKISEFVRDAIEQELIRRKSLKFKNNDVVN